MSQPIPIIREKMNDLADRLQLKGLEDEADELRLLALDTYRKRPKRRVSAQSDPVTPAIRGAVIDYAENNPDAPQSEIAHAFNLNPGRVSEILA